MRTLAAAIIVVTAASWADAQSQQESLGTFKSTLDNRMYDVRRRGDTGLDIYTAEGSLAAVLERKNPKDSYKGKTQTMAVRCPQQSGKIEAVSADNERIRMRVEVPSKDIRNQMSCNMLLLSAWQPFDLVRPGGDASPITQGSSSQAPQEPDSGSRTVKDVRVDFVEALAERGTLTVTFSVTNMGQDRMFGTGHPACTAVQLTDNFNNTYQPASTTVGNRPYEADLISGVSARMTMRFDNLPTRGGVMEATQIARLTMLVIVGSGDSYTCNAKVPVEFRGLAIKRAS